uniref:Ig-like domain-containing protein n=1 Tax=Pelusios castaneus TaxID=367368 RepID=A0A8C8RP23_9SAUR
YVCVHLPVCSVAGNSVTQLQRSSSATEGQRVKLNCQYSTTSFYLYWYQQLPKKPPQFLLRRHSGGSEYKPSTVAGRFSSQLDTGAKSFTLSIDGAQLIDSAVYFCALSDRTVPQTALGPLHKVSYSGV